MIFSQAFLISSLFAKTYKENVKLFEDLKEHDRARTLFFHNTSHELRTPLNGIIGFTQTLLKRKQGSLDEESLSKLTKIETLSESLRILVNTILDLAKSKKGELDIIESKISLNYLAKQSQILAEGIQGDKLGLNFILKSNWSGEDEHFIFPMDM